MSNEVSDLSELSALQLRRRVISREVSPREVAEAALRRIDSVDATVRAFVTVNEELTFAAADAVELRLNAEESLPLAGVPYALKDLTDTAGLRTTYGSKFRENYVPQEDAAVARRLRDAGGVLLGKTNTPEFGNRANTAFGLFPATRNPWNLARTAGGSSGGSAAAVAACLCPVAEGSDGGGSVRIPASCCGVVGIKPSRGRVSSAPSSNPRGGLTTFGPIARTVRDAALVLDVMSGAELGDLFRAPPPATSFLKAADQEPRSLKIGIMTESRRWIHPEVVDAVLRTGRLLESLGHSVEVADINLGGLEEAFRVFVDCENAAIPVDSPEQFSDPYTRLCYARGSQKTAADYIHASELLIGRSREIQQQFEKWDCLITPTVASVPPPIDTFLAVTENAADDDLAFIPFTFPFNITGQPAISLPLGWSNEGLPIGVQLVGPLYGESQIIGLAAQIEQAQPWISKYPATMARG